jgi:ATP phosphoribosyltransferase regulatory subunit
VRVRAGLPTGVTALLFGAARARRQLEATLTQRLVERGYQEALLPILDYFDPYGPMLSAGAREQLYRFVDRDGQLLALRADFTPMLARLLAPRLDALELPLRLFYRGDVVRYQEGKPGQLREYSQLGAELLTPIADGADERGRGDAEIVELLLDLLSGRLGAAASPEPSSPAVPAIRLVLGLAGALDPLLRHDPHPRELAQAIARRDRARARAESRDLLAIVERGFPDDPAVLGDAAPDLDRLLRLRDRLEARRGEVPVHVTVDLAEFAAEGLDPIPTEAPPGDSPATEQALPRASYYDGVVFRAYVDGLGQPVASGGRYDGLFRGLGARVRAAGFQVALDPLLEATQRRVAPAADVSEAAR